MNQPDVNSFIKRRTTIIPCLAWILLTYRCYVSLHFLHLLKIPTFGLHWKAAPGLLLLWQLRYSSQASLLLQHTQDNSLARTAIESEMASRQPQLLLLESKEGERGSGGVFVCVPSHRIHKYTPAAKRKQHVHKHM